MLINLRDAILRVAQYFQVNVQTALKLTQCRLSCHVPFFSLIQAADPGSFSHVSATADYSMESHSRDHDAFLAVSRSKRKRARY